MNLIQYILFEDESMIRDYQTIGVTWFERRKQKIIKAFGKHRGVKFMGWFDNESGYIYCEEHENYGAQRFLEFLTNISMRYFRKIVRALDNAKIHHAKLIQTLLEENKAVLNFYFCHLTVRN